ncbi:MAG: 50S ribosomal protein L10 [Bryobacteraceae bacterium]|nr:50S ribosomal protein L10 [Bryobacteraceae bacterium]
MKKKADKEKDLQALKDMLAKTPAMFVTGFEKMTVAQDFELRRTIKGAGGNYQVVKNTLAEKASDGTEAARLLSGLKGMTSLAWTTEDPVALAKALTKYAKDHPSLTFRAGMVQGRVIDIAAINELASLPSKEEIYAKLLWLINAPAQRLVTAVNGVGRNLAVVVDQGVKENKFTA